MTEIYTINSFQTAVPKSCSSAGLRLHTEVLKLTWQSYSKNHGVVVFKWTVTKFCMLTVYSLLEYNVEMEDNMMDTFQTIFTRNTHSSLVNTSPWLLSATPSGITSSSGSLFIAGSRRTSSVVSCHFLVISSP